MGMSVPLLRKHSSISRRMLGVSDSGLLQEDVAHSAQTGTSCGRNQQNSLPSSQVISGITVKELG